MRGNYSRGIELIKFQVSDMRHGTYSCANFLPDGLSVMICSVQTPWTDIFVLVSGHRRTLYRKSATGLRNMPCHYSAKLLAPNEWCNSCTHYCMLTRARGTISFIRTQSQRTKKTKEKLIMISDSSYIDYTHRLYCLWLWWICNNDLASIHIIAKRILYTHYDKTTNEE